MSEQIKSGWGLTRNMRGVRKVTNAERVESPIRWRRGWRDAKGFVPDGCLFDTKEQAIEVARRYANAALTNAHKMVVNAERDLDKLKRLALQPE